MNGWNVYAIVKRNPVYKLLICICMLSYLQAGGRRVNKINKQKKIMNQWLDINDVYTHDKY